MDNQTENIDLEEFVSEVLTQLISGIKKAQSHAKENGATVNPSNIVRNVKGDLVFDNSMSRSPIIQEIEFDVAVTVSSGGGLKGGMGLFIPVAGIGYQANKETGNSTVSRIRFKIPIVPPMQD